MEDQEIKEEQENTEIEKEPDFVVELHMQNIAEALEDYFVKHDFFIQGDHFERLFMPFDMKMVSPEMTFLVAGNVIPSEHRLDPIESPRIDPKKLN